MFKVPNRITLEDFSMLNLIGKGTYAKVVLAKRNDTGHPYAIKILKKAQVIKKKQEEYVLLEKKILTQVEHPFIIKMAGCFQSPQKLFFVLEYCPGGDLYGLITKRHRFTEEQARFYSAQIILALEHLHSKNFVYRDLKPENILLDKSGYIKLTDFGLSSICFGNQETSFMAGTPQYLAPQILNKQPHGRSVDFWCLGNIIYEMVSGIPPFYGNNNEDTFQKIKTQNPIYPPKMSSRLKSLLDGLLSKNAQQRLGFQGFQQIKSHPWFSKTDWGSLLKKQIKSPFIPLVEEQYDISNFDPEFTECEVNSWDDKKSSCDDIWDLSDFSYEGDNLDQIESDLSQSGSFEMKTQEETTLIQ